MEDMTFDEWKKMHVEHHINGEKESVDMNNEEEMLKITDLISDDNLCQIAKNEINLLPDYFWTVAASSSGKYHPSYTLGEGGLARHVIAACKIALDLFSIYDFSEKEQDSILISLLLHDGFKRGKEDTGCTVHEHPILMKEYLLDKYGEAISDIAKAIGSHMGQWTTSKYSETVLDKPKTELEKFVHMCDYLASRKDVEIKFKGEE